jgi:hypothetical protein
MVMGFLSQGEKVRCLSRPQGRWTAGNLVPKVMVWVAFLHPCILQTLVGMHMEYIVNQRMLTPGNNMYGIIF